jgi:hypothetical protein
MKLTKKLLNKPIILDFIDHSANAKEVVKCRAIGWVESISDLYVVLRHWDIPEDQDCDRDTNSEFISIIKNTIFEITLLK